MKQRQAMAIYVASKREVASKLPENGVCPTTRVPYSSCSCDNHRCGDCGRRRSQRLESDRRGESVATIGCQCERNRRQNGFPPHWRTGPIGVR